MGENDDVVALGVGWEKEIIPYDGTGKVGGALIFWGLNRVRILNMPRYGLAPSKTLCKSLLANAWRVNKLLTKIRRFWPFRG